VVVVRAVGDRQDRAETAVLVEAVAAMREAPLMQAALELLVKVITAEVLREMLVIMVAVVAVALVGQEEMVLDQQEVVAALGPLTHIADRP
jgi:hypothetical protein